MRKGVWGAGRPLPGIVSKSQPDWPPDHWPVHPRRGGGFRNQTSNFPPPGPMSLRFILASQLLGETKILYNKTYRCNYGRLCLCMEWMVTSGQAEVWPVSSGSKPMVLLSCLCRVLSWEPRHQRSGLMSHINHSTVDILQYYKSKIMEEHKKWSFKYCVGGWENWEEKNLDIFRSIHLPRLQPVCSQIQC